MDYELRKLLQAWGVSPGDKELANAVNAAARRVGGVSISEAEAVRLLGNTLIKNIEQIRPNHRAINLEMAQHLANTKPGDQLSIATDYAPMGFEWEIAHQVAVIFARENTSHAYPDDYPDYPKSKLYSAVIKYAKCDCRANRGRGCGQVAMGCIETTICSACNRCSGCQLFGRPFHESHCVCDDFYESTVGSDGFGAIGFLTHSLPHLCGCHGSGWQSTDADSVHRCPLHPVTSHHPECDNYEGDPSECCASY